MKVKGLLAGIGVVLAILVCARQTVAQAAPGVFADATHPAGAPDPEKLDQIWQVDPLTGSVSITIPFTTTPAGGRGPKIPFSLHYNSASTVTLQSVYSTTVPNTANSVEGMTTTEPPYVTQWFTWGAGDISGPAQGPVGPWTTSGPFFYTNTNTVSEQNFTEYINNTNYYVMYGSGCIFYGPYIYTDESGAAHDMNLEKYGYPLGSDPSMSPPCQNAFSANYTYGSTFYTTDGSALATQCCVGAPNVLRPDGTQVFASTTGATLEDSNGNTASLAFNTTLKEYVATDSLGRQAFSTTLPIGAAGQIGTNTYNVKTTGATGNIEMYSVVFSQISLGSFTMPHPISGPGGTATSEIQNLGYCVATITCPTGYGVYQVGYGPAGAGSTLGTTLPVVSSITLPDSTQYAFTYDPTYGTISKIVFPTGGYVRFVWGIRGDGGGHGQFLLLSTIVVTEVCTSTGSGGENCWQYNFPSYSSTTGLTSTVTAPDASYTAYTGVPVQYTGVPLYTMGAAPSWKEASRLEYNSSGTLMKSVATTYNLAGPATGLPSQVATTLYDGPTPLQQYVQYIYDSTSQAPISYYAAEYAEEIASNFGASYGYNVSYGNVIEKDESDFNPCSGSPCPMPTTLPSFLRSTYTSYAYASNPAMAAAYIVDKPYQVLVTNGSGNPASLTTYAYDEPGHISGGLTGISTHDDVNYGSGSTRPRGNLTTESKCISGITVSSSSGSWTASCGSFVNNSYYYDLTGQLTQKIEGGTGPSSPATTTYTWSGPNGTSDGYNGFLTKVQHPDGTKDQYTYWQPIGAIYQHTDVNTQTTTYSYESYLNRIASIVLPSTTDGTTGSAGNGGTIYTYTDTPGAFSVQEQHPVDTTGTTTSVTKTYDGLGRAIQTAAAVPATQCSGGTLFTQTTYDSMSRVYSVSNPYCSTSDPTYGLTYFAYDGLGRKIRTTLPDGAVSTIAYAGNATETTDPPNGTTSVQHIQQSNGLGFLTSVCEVGLAPLATGGPQPCGLNIAGSGSLTTYTYNPLGNMLSVNQHGLGRSFTYDSLSRLTTALNPEVGLDTYTYSSSTSACSPSADVPCSRQDARGVITSYAYDSMSRLINKSYSTAASNTTGTVSDLTSCYLYGTTQSNNTVGRLIAEWQQAGTCASSIPTTASAITVRKHPSYDAMGRLLLDQQCLTGASCSSTTGNFVYTYNLLGNPVQSNNGIFAAQVPATQTAPANPATGNGTTIAAPSITWRTTYDIADHINYAGVQDQPSTSVFPTATYSFAPTLLKPTAYDSFSHMTGAQLSIPNGSTTQAINIARQYDIRGRILNETDGGDVITSPSSGSTGLISLSGTEAGPLTATATSGTGTLTVTGSEGYQTICTTTCNQYTCWQTCNAVPDTGTLAVTIHGFTSSVSYSSGSTDASLAAALTAGFNASNSPVTAVQNGSSFTLTAKATGTASNYPITFSNGDFTVSDPYSTLTGGSNAVASVYDAGTVTATISGGSPAVNITTAPVTWGQGDTPATLATKLASAINTASSSYVTATASGSTINLTSTGTGAGVDYAVSVSIADTQTATYPSLFPSASFTASASSMTGGTAAQSGNGTIYSYLIPQGGYAPNGNILAHTDSVMGTWNFSYDAVDRLTSATAGSNAPTVFRGQSAAWSYDSYGNRTAQTFSNSVVSNWVNYNPANNRITTATSAVTGYVYDASGNTLYDGNNEYWYDAEGQLCAVQSQALPGLPITQYVYDAEGARIAKGTLSAAPSNSTSLCAPPLSSGFTLSARYLVDQGGDQVTELSEQSGEVWKHSNVFSTARLTATYDTSGLHFELADPLGTKRVQANIYGQIEMSWVSLPFGDALTPILPPNPPSTADDATEHHFTQKERDSESNNDYFFARYYNSAIGRFTTPDWSAKVAPVPYAQMGDPQSLNLYAYVRNNPLIHVDADGHGGLNCSGNNAGGIGCLWRAALDAAHGIDSQVLRDVLSYFGGSTQQQQSASSPASSGHINNHAFANYMDANALSHADGHCARYCRKGMEAGGLNTNGRPNDAKNYGPFLLKHGYHIVTITNYFGNQQVGDIAVFQQAPGHSESGHIEMWDGHRWISDFKQRNFSPYNGLGPSDLNFKIYRQDNQ